jgi:molybdopterin-guanine dinucleotide biosynthesis adapter protein
VHRPALGKPPIWPEQADIVAIATDAPVSADRMVLPLNDHAAITAWIVTG